MKGRYFLHNHVTYSLAILALSSSHIFCAEPTPNAIPPLPAPVPSPSPVPTPAGLPATPPAMTGTPPAVPIPTAPAAIPGPTTPGLPMDTTTQLPEQIGIQGNWVKKKKWLIAAQEVSNEAQNLLLQLENLRKTFNQNYDAIDKQLDDFYQNNGIEQGGIKELFSSIHRYLEKKRKEKVENDSSQAVKTRKNMIHLKFV